MKNKKLLLPGIILGVAFVLTIISTFIAAIAMKPTITEGEFPFTITYELDGEIVTISDVYKVHYEENKTNKYRYYVGGIGAMGDGECVYTLKKDATGRIELWTHFQPDYMMGDSEYFYYDAYDYAPIISYYNANETEYTDEETLAEKGVRLISFEYPEPIENNFVFSHFVIPQGDVIFPAFAIAMLSMIVTLIFVKKDADYTRRSPVNILTIVLNFFISLTFLPFILICAYLLTALGDAGDVLNLVFFLLPALTVFCITASIGLRRRLCYKSGLYVQFVSPAIFAVILFVGNLLGAL